MTDVAPKYEELKEIFAKCGEEMEWEAIEKEAVSKQKGWRNGCRRIKYMFL
jgi:hypothetical protein